ncbi:Terpenoid synthases superfamily protein [Striga hermonthica]|uniref:Terpenoid synthases superfamily protein n=1 Tax=Striga hermonthica TaxID=68872 RepID=A0A9N7RIH5_STRHE|nr:Terpenoid synthases superfamily protein [Striga hermonthica]
MEKIMPPGAIWENFLEDFYFAGVVEVHSISCNTFPRFVLLLHHIRFEGILNSNQKNDMSGARTAFSYCVQQVRNYDYHHYLCLLELPLNMRRSAFALRAFNVETARAMDVASDPRIGLMRLLWWQEAIDKIFSNKLVEHPVAQALASVISEHKFSKSWLKRSVQARIDDARRDVSNIPETIEDLERYAEDTMSTILYSTLEADGIRSTAADHAASHIGKASGLALLLRSLPYHAGRNRHFLYVPADVAKKHGLLVNKSENLVDSREGLCSAVYEMASVANAHLQKARELAETVPVEARPVMLPAVPTQFVLDTLRRVQFDVFDPRLTRGILGVPPLWFQLTLKYYSWRGRY